MMPPARMLVGVDFSKPSRTAFEFAVRMSRHCGASLEVAHIEDPLLVAVAKDKGFDLNAQTQEELRRFVAAAAPGMDVPCRLGGGDAVDGLCAEALRHRADLIVVAAHGMSGVSRLVFGSTAEGLLRRATCSVLVVPDTWTPPSPDASDLTGVGPIICGVDLTLTAIEAARAAARLAACLHTNAALLHVVPQLRVLERWQSHADGALQWQVRLIRREIERATAAFTTISPMSLEVEVGNVPEHLAQLAAKHPHCLLVLGRILRSTGSSPPGSNAHRVLGLAHVPVLMYVTQE